MRKRETVRQRLYKSCFTQFSRLQLRTVGMLNVCECLLCISTSFWVLRAPKSWLNYFFSAILNLFCTFQTFFSDFTAEINEKRLKKNKKMCFCLLLKAGPHAKAGRLLEGVPRNCLFSVDFLLFQHFATVFGLFCSSTSLWVHAAPKSWSKYTTSVIDHLFLTGQNN